MTTPRPARKSRANGEGTLYQRQDGRWEAAGYVLATDGSRKRVRVYGTTRKEAADKLAERIAASNQGRPVAAADSTVTAYLTYWLDSVAVHRLRENTHTRYRTCVRLYVIPGLGRKKIAHLTARDIRSWLDRLRTTCQCCARGLDKQERCCTVGQCCDKRLSPLTVTYVHSVLKSALEHAVREDELPRNVARNIKAGTPRPRRFEPLTVAEARRFLASVDGHRLQALFDLALRTGLRKGELLGLRWEDLDLDGGTASIRRTLQRTPTGGLTALPTKTVSSERRIALPTECVHSLKHHRERQNREREVADTGWTDSGYVFTASDGSPTDPSTLTRHFTTLCQVARLRRIRFHDLRHTAATLLLEQGVELVVIKELLGHAHIGVTATVYAHVRLRLQRQAIDTLGKALRAPETPDDSPSAEPVR
ncbi:tyrosine-type recombinase/integrase [Streptomyces sp. SP17BM10]|uniref:tyrosine-type recombinase/integrase n=1 Tax=Streptomyces sp. SP17BM10 TaxID=3002530 RepID=UPI002E77D144|nr:tyrosine-type recombinase/integrase [Streptomyces sp. SP17BM10]MEE1782761.1 tyrosine-type recombinase/integrase [Streptomyces sp. SP17BM10]